MQVARDILEKAAKRNGLHNEDITQAQLEAIAKPISDEEISRKKEGQLGFLDIFRYPILRRRALVMYFNWFVNRWVHTKIDVIDYFKMGYVPEKTSLS